MSCVKYLLFAFNFVFCLSGIAIIVVGAVIQTGYSDYTSFVPSYLSGAPILLIIVGSIIFFIAFLGCCGACQESYCMMITFSVFLGIIFILELAAGITALVNKETFTSGVYTAMDEVLKQAKNGNIESQQAWTTIQQGLKCCGVNGTLDWTTTPALLNNCCIDGVPEKGVCTKGFYTSGCYSSMKSLIHDNFVIVGGVAIAIAFIQIMGIVCACCMAGAIKEG